MKGQVLVLAWLDQVGVVRFLGVDVDLSRVHRYEAAVTDFPVEDGSAISDHVVLRPIGLSFEMLVSDTPIGYQNDYYTPGPFDDDRARGRKAYEALTAIWRDKTIVDCITPFGVLSSCIITGITVPEDQGHQGGFYASVDLREIKLATSQAVLVQAAARKKALKAATVAELLTQGLTAAAEKSAQLDRWLVDKLEAQATQETRWDAIAEATSDDELGRLEREFALEDLQAGL